MGRFTKGCRKRAGESRKKANFAAWPQGHGTDIISNLATSIRTSNICCWITACSTELSHPVPTAALSVGSGFYRKTGTSCCLWDPSDSSAAQESQAPIPLRISVRPQTMYSAPNCDRGRGAPLLRGGMVTAHGNTGKYSGRSCPS